MKKLLMIMLLTFTTMTYADEGRYSMLSIGDREAIWVLDTEKGKLKFCWRAGEPTLRKIHCNKEGWKDLNDDED